MNADREKSTLQRQRLHFVILAGGSQGFGSKKQRAWIQRSNSGWVRDADDPASWAFAGLSHPSRTGAESTAAASGVVYLCGVASLRHSHPVDREPPRFAVGCLALARISSHASRRLIDRARAHGLVERFWAGLFRSRRCSAVLPRLCDHARESNSSFDTRPRCRRSELFLVNHLEEPTSTRLCCRGPLGASSAHVDVRGYARRGRDSACSRSVPVVPQPER